MYLYVFICPLQIQPKPTLNFMTEILVVYLNSANYFRN